MVKFLCYKPLWYAVNLYLTLTVIYYTTLERSDILVLGSGIAGLTYALEVAHLGKVTVLCKTEPLEGSTRYAQGGIASVTSSVDSFASHYEDTIRAGAGLCDEKVVQAVVHEGPSSIELLTKLGASFDRSEHGYALGQEGGHSQRRILHARDSTGAEIQRTLYQAALAHQNIEIRSSHFAIDLIRHRRYSEQSPSSRDEVIGIYAFDCQKHAVVAYAAKVTMLATGGAGKVYLYTSNPDVATGDGIAMAYRAGCSIANMEFFQFHPTCLYHPKAKSFLITEAMRGEGARLLGLDREPFMARYDERGELAPRDIVARAIDQHMKETGADYVLLDISHRDASFIQERFPLIYAETKKFGFDLTREPIPVVPAAHYCCGGVVSDLSGRTDLPRLYVAGETASTGLHGANRLASNSLLEAVVFARRAGADTIRSWADYARNESVAEWDYVDATESSEEVLVSHTWDELRRLMWNLVGVVRSDRRLEAAKRRIGNIRAEIQDYYWRYLITPDLLELRNIIDVADLIVSSALQRRESRGLHYNIDCPLPDDLHWRKNTVLRKEEEQASERNRACA